MRTGIQIISDTHLEFRTPKTLPLIHKHADNLALLGDIGKPFMASYSHFLGEQALKFDNVFVIMGNHEYYHSSKTADKVLEQAKRVCSQWNNVHLLERTAYNVTDQTVVLGCTLWSNMQSFVAGSIADTSKIKVAKQTPLVVDTYRQWHQRDVEWLQETLDQVQEQGKQAIVLTHHGPLLDMSGQYKGSFLDSAFTTDLSHLFKPPLLAWASGHVHSNCDIEYNGVRSVSNALGYPNEATGYKENVVIHLP